MKTIAFSDGILTFEGAVSVEIGAGWASPWRIDADKLDFYPSLKEGVAHHASGVRLCFATDSTHIRLTAWPREFAYNLDLYADSERASTVRVKLGTETIDFGELAAGMKDIEIWLPNTMPFWLKSVQIDDAATISAMTQSRKRWVHYGSSISHSSCANRPSEIWAGIAARKMNLHLTNLGFSGNCNLDPMVACIIRDTPADIITLKLGINNYHGALTTRTFPANTIGLINIIREKHADTPIVVISPIISPPRETIAGESGYTLQGMRDTLADIVDTFRRYGDEHIHYVDGLKIFGNDDLKHLPDNLHPSSDGQFVMAAHVVTHALKDNLN